MPVQGRRAQAPSDHAEEHERGPGDRLEERVTTFIWAGLGALVSFGGYSLWGVHASVVELDQRCLAVVERVGELHGRLTAMPDGTELRRILPRLESLEQWRGASENRLDRVESEILRFHHPKQE